MTNITENQSNNVNPYLREAIDENIESFSSKEIKMLYSINLDRDSKLFQLLNTKNISVEQMDQAKEMLKCAFESLPPEEVHKVKMIKDVQWDEDVAKLGFKNLGLMTDLYKNQLSSEILEDGYRVWIWENSKGERVAICDYGNTSCGYLCEGTEEAITSYYEQSK